MTALSLFSTTYTLLTTMHLGIGSCCLYLCAHVTLLVLKSLILFFREKPVKAHLQNVYTAMGVALLAAAVGGYLHLFTDFMIVCISNFFWSLLFRT